MWQTIENSIRALAERAVICWSVARVSERALLQSHSTPPPHLTPPPAERIRERERHAAQRVTSIWISIRFSCICLERGHISHQASIHFSCLLRGCSSRESAFLNVPASIRSCLCGPLAAGSALCSKRRRERKLYCWASQGHMEGGGTCRSLFPLCYLYFFFPFPSFNCVRFSLALGYFQSFFFFFFPLLSLLPILPF